MGSGFGMSDVWVMGCQHDGSAVGAAVAFWAVQRDRAHARIVPVADVRLFCQQELKLCLVAPSLGGVETLITRPITTTHVGFTKEECEVRRCALPHASCATAAQTGLSPVLVLTQASGVTEGLIRVAVGIESTGHGCTLLTSTTADRHSHPEVAVCPAADVIEDFQLALASLAQMGNTLQDGKATEFGVRTSILTKSGLSMVKSLADEMATSMAMPTNPVPTAV